MKPQIIAHRGWSGKYPENTITAFKKALELPVDGVEFDLRMTRDGKIVISHDAAVDRRSNGNGLISDMTLAELKQLDFGIKTSPQFAGTRIPEFSELLDLVEAERPDLWLAVEIKENSQELVIRAIDELKRRKFDSRCSIISFESDVLFVAQKYAPEIPRHGFPEKYLPETGGTDRYINMLNRVGLNIKDLTTEIVEFYHSRNIKVDTWAPGNAEEYAKSRNVGIDFITTNDPDVILKLQAECQE